MASAHHEGEAFVGDVARERLIRTAIDTPVVLRVLDPGQAGVNELSYTSEDVTRVVEDGQAEAREKGHDRACDLTAAGEKLGLAQCQQRQAREEGVLREGTRQAFPDRRPQRSVAI